MQQSNNSLALRILGLVEKAASRLPDPSIIFLVLAIVTIIASAITAHIGISVTHPGTGETIQAVNLATAENIRMMLKDVVKNFINFPPLGIVLAMVLGIGVAEQSGYISVGLRLLTTVVSEKFIMPLLVFAGVMSSLAADAGYVVLIPLGATLFLAYGRHPLAGMAVTFAGVAGGFSANLFVTSLDPLLGGLTQSAAAMIAPEYTIEVTANYYFMAASVFLLVAVGTWVGKKITEPRLGNYTGTTVADQQSISLAEKRGFKAGTIFMLVFGLAVAGLTIPEQALLRDSEGTIKPFFEALIPLLMVMFLGAGIIHGRIAGSIQNGVDIARMAAESMASMGSFLVLSFVAAQFIAYFHASKLGIIIAVNGASFLQQTGLQGTPLLVAFIALCGGVNLMISSASAKWAIMAPVFVPMLMLMGYSPEVTQLAYRIGDSSTNMIAPLMSYVPLIIAFARKYDENISLGNILVMMLPFSIAFFIAWVAFLGAWLLLGLPIGPGVSVFYP